MSANPLGIADLHHVALHVTDLDTALAFYVDVLGFSVLPRPDFPNVGAWLDVGTGRQIHLVEVPTDKVPADVGQHVALEIADADAAATVLAAAGVEHRGPKRVGPATQVVLHDPDGNRIELNQPDPA